MKTLLFAIVWLDYCFFLGDSTPVIVNVNGNGSIPSPETINPSNPSNLCILPEELGSTGTSVPAEECDTFERFGTSIPKKVESFTGSSVLVCCPENLNGKIFFPKKVDDEDSDDTGDAYEEYMEEPYNPEENCKRIPGSTCVEIDQCSDEEFNGPIPPTGCGFSTENGKDKVCCKKKGKRTEKPISRKYGSKNYDCEDHSSYCSIFLQKDPNSCSTKHESFGFMRDVCPKSCNRCANKGCVDEFEKCDDWTKAGHCYRYADFMFYNCKESCGSCGFRSKSNHEPQTIKGRDYSNLKSPQFYCGEGKKKTSSDLTNRKTRSPQDQEAPKNNTNFSDSNIKCGSTIINDRFVVLAAHCSTSLKTRDEGVSSVDSTFIRDGSIYKEAIEFRNTFVHPKFQFPKLYHDIAIGELARRIDYDYDKYGDSPACLAPEDLQAEGLTAITQGYGYTEHSTTSDVLLEGHVILMNNVECNEWFHSNLSKYKDRYTSFKSSFNHNITDGLICSRGIFNPETKIYSGPCQGDSGGPLYLNRGKGDLRQQTLIGIVSAGFSCGTENIPAIYTRLSAYRPWIDCIISGVEQNLRKTEIETNCYEFANII